MSAPLKVVVSGAGGQIGYIVSVHVASGEVFGSRDINLVLVDPPARPGALDALIMEINDCAFARVASATVVSTVEEACKDADFVFMMCSAPMKPGTPRVHLLGDNALVFKMHGEALRGAKKTVKALIVGNPVNTNAQVCLKFATGLGSENFCALTRLDHNRAIHQIADKTGVRAGDVKSVYVWGNHAPTMIADLSTAMVGDKKVLDVVSEEYVRTEFVQTVSVRGGAVMTARGAASVISAAHATIDCARDWWNGTGDRIVSMAIPVPEDSPYGIKPGVVFSFPVKVDSNGKVSVVMGLPVEDWLQTKLDATEADLIGERDIAYELLGIQ